MSYKAAMPNVSLKHTGVLVCFFLLFHFQAFKKKCSLRTENHETLARTGLLFLYINTCLNSGC